jgi:hypothetical protein
MNFKIKWLLHNIIYYLPAKDQLNFLFQKYISKNLPLNNEKFVEKVFCAYNTYLNFLKYSSDKNKSAYYEFGAGWDLIVPITMSLLGFGELYCIDINKLIFSELISETINKFKSLKINLPFEYVIDSEFSNNQENINNYLKRKFRINYKAPLNASDTNFKSGSMNFISSTAVMEHIPADDLQPILNECYRILSKNGIVSLIIDYKDHYSYFDKNISVYNFLKYSNHKWKIFNDPMQYQNRLRHKDYLSIIKRSGFKILEENLSYPDSNELMILKNLKMDKFYLSNYKIEELSIKGCHFILKK